MPFVLVLALLFGAVVLNRRLAARLLRLAHRRAAGISQTIAQHDTRAPILFLSLTKTLCVLTPDTSSETLLRALQQARQSSNVPLSDVLEQVRARLALERDPASLDALMLAGWLAFEVGDFSASPAFTRPAVKLSPSVAQAEFRLGLALLALGETDDAEAAYRRGLALAGRRTPERARRSLESALHDLSLLPHLANGAATAADRVRASLTGKLQEYEGGGTQEP